jgi:7-keto-8-aminopelargonate synthetase-like enzyme
MGPGDVICCDERLHNSGWLGARHSGARVLPFAHGDAAALDRILQKERTRYRRALIAIESVYSADGDVADLASFVAVKERHGALLFVDEAHGTGVLGATGRGLAEATGIPSAAVDIWMGTLSKALASCGGFIAGARSLVNYLRTTCPAFVFSVGMPPGTAAAALAAVQLLRQEPERVETLRARAMAFRMQAAAAGLPVETSGTTATSPIIPIITGGSAGALALAAALEREGVLAAPMLPPAVPAGASRVLFFVSAAHAEFQVSAAVAELVRTYPAVVL